MKREWVQVKWDEGDVLSKLLVSSELKEGEREAAREGGWTCD